MKFVLASNSPRRKKILSQFGLNPIITSHKFNEASIDENLSPEEYCKLISKGKLHSIISDWDSFPVISADTIVVIDNIILEKPIDKDDALRMLNCLSGKEHLVITAVNFCYKNKDIEFSFIEKTFVKFNILDQKDILYYVDTYNPYDKSGSYGIQDFSAVFVESIKGCFFNVMGLPLSTLFQYLKKFDLVNFPLDIGG